MAPLLTKLNYKPELQIIFNNPESIPPKNYQKSPGLTLAQTELFYDTHLMLTQVIGRVHVHGLTNGYQNRTALVNSNKKP